MPGPDLADPRDVRSFVESKRIKREPIHVRATGRGEATFNPRTAASFERVRGQLRGIGDWGRASERLDALEHALRARHGHGLPRPRTMIQHADASLAVLWEGCMIRCFTTGLITMINRQPHATTVTATFLDMLGQLHKLQKR